jgi:hypothetical protein
VAKAEVVIESMTSPPSASGGLHIDAGARAPGDSVESILIDDSNESESCGSLQKTGKQHRDGEVNLLLDRLQKLDPEDFAKGRGQWINRATGSPKAGDDCRRELVDAVSAVEHARLLGESFRKPLGKVFALARKWSVDHGKKLRSVLFT